MKSKDILFILLCCFASISTLTAGTMNLAVSRVVVDDSC